MAQQNQDGVKLRTFWQAITVGDYKTVKVMLEYRNCDVNEYDLDGEQRLGCTALHLAILEMPTWKTSSEEFVRNFFSLLLTHNADIEKVCNYRGEWYLQTQVGKTKSFFPDGYDALGLILQFIEITRGADVIASDVPHRLELIRDMLLNHIEEKSKPKRGRKLISSNSSSPVIRSGDRKLMYHSSPAPPSSLNMSPNVVSSSGSGGSGNKFLQQRRSLTPDVADVSSRNNTTNAPPTRLNVADVSGSGTGASSSQQNSTTIAAGVAEDDENRIPLAASTDDLDQRNPSAAAFASTKASFLRFGVGEVAGNIASDLGMALYDQDPSSFSDVVLRCHQREFYAHRFILSARSSVFQAMFRWKTSFPPLPHPVHPTAATTSSTSTTTATVTSLGGDVQSSLVLESPANGKGGRNNFPIQVDDTSRLVVDVLNVQDPDALALFLHFLYSDEIIIACECHGTRRMSLNSSGSGGYHQQQLLYVTDPYYYSSSESKLSPPAKRRNPGSIDANFINNGGGGTSSYFGGASDGGINSPSSALALAATAALIPTTSATGTAATASSSSSSSLGSMAVDHRSPSSPSSPSIDTPSASSTGYHYHHYHHHHHHQQQQQQQQQQHSQSAFTSCYLTFQELLFLADRYDVSQLKMLCVEELKLLVCVENAVALLVLSEATDSPELKEAVLEFIADHNAEVAKTPEFLDLDTAMIRDIITFSASSVGGGSSSQLSHRPHHHYHHHQHPSGGHGTNASDGGPTATISPPAAMLM